MGMTIIDEDQFGELIKDHEVFISKNPPNDLISLRRPVSLRRPEKIPYNGNSERYFKYKNFKEEISVRHISVKCYLQYNSSHKLLLGYCNEEGAMRSFREDRILKELSQKEYNSIKSESLNTLNLPS